MSARAVLDSAIVPALQLLPARMDTREARVLLLAIGLQESRLIHRRQLVGSPPRPTGPAAGLWQFEEGGGCAGVLSHEASRDLVRWCCWTRRSGATRRDLWRALQVDDTLAAAAARLLLWTDPQPLPRVGDAAKAWAYYLRVWRPGKPHRGTWGALYAEAEAVA